MDDYNPHSTDVVNDTFASNPGHVKMQWTRFFRAYPIGFYGFGTAFLVLLWLVFTKSFWWLIPLLPLIVLDWLILKRTQTQFRSGDTNPGLILSQNPPLVAVFTDLSKGFGEYPVLKILEQPLKACGLGNAPAGTRVTMCSLYQMSAEEVPHWLDFDPVLVQAATRRTEVQETRLKSVAAEEWEQLEKALAKITEHKPGLYPLGWQPQEGGLNQG